MKKIISLSVFYFTYLFLFSQPASIQWKKCFGGSNDESANAIQQTTDSGYVLAGWTVSNDGYLKGNHGGMDFWILKLNKKGIIEWQKVLGGTKADIAYAIEQTQDGGYVVAGSTYSNDGDVSGNHQDATMDCWVVKLNSNGSVQWQKCFGGSRYDEAYSIQQTSDGGYVLAGYSTSNDGDVSGNHGAPSGYTHNNSDAWVAKLNGLGALQWQKSLGGTGAEDVNSIEQTSDGGYVLTGYTSSVNDGDVKGNHPGIYDIWVVKLTCTGAIQWQKCLGGSHNEEAYCIQQTSDGGYVLAGRTQSGDGDVNGYHGYVDYDSWVIKLNSTGGKEWQKCLGGTRNEYANSIRQTTDGGYILAGWSASGDGDVKGNHGGKDFWVVQLSNSGGVEWQKCYGGPNDDESYCVQITNDGGYVIVGGSRSADGDVTGNHGNEDCLIMKLYSNATDLNGDGITNNADILILLGQFNYSCKTGQCLSDINGDGVTNNIDLLLLIGHFNQTSNKPITSI